MTKYEKYIYNKREEEFFDKLYNSNSLGVLSRRDYKDTNIVFYQNSLALEYEGQIRNLNLPISLKDVDYMAHLYASYQIGELREFLTNELSYSSYVGKHFFIDMDMSHNHFYSEDTIEKFKKINNKNKQIEIGD